MPKLRILLPMCRLTYATLTLLVCLPIQSSLAFIITPTQPGADNLSSATAIYTTAATFGAAQKTAFVNPFAMEPLIRGGTVEFLNALNSDYPAWTASPAPGDLNGSFNIINYYACGANTSCGTEVGVTATNGVGSMIDIDYVPGIGDPVIGTDLHWIQRVANNHHLSNGHGTTDDKIDVWSGQADPYYDTGGFAGIGSTVGLPLRPFMFVDRPYRSDEQSNHDWVAELYLVEETATKTVTVYNGIRWGWGNIDSTTSSTSRSAFTSTFEKPLPDSATHTGIGTNSITWGIPFSASDISSALSITPQPYGNPVIGQLFVAGLVTYTNGTVQNATGLESVVLKQKNVISVLDLDVSEQPVDDHRTVTMNNTPNTSDPIASADYVSIPPAPGIGTTIFPNIGNNFHVLEGQTATATLLGLIVESDIADFVTPDTDPVLPPSPDALVGTNPQNQQFDFEWLGYGNVIQGNGFVTSGRIDVNCDVDHTRECPTKLIWNIDGHSIDLSPNLVMVPPGGRYDLTLRATIPGDANFDRIVDVGDLGIVGANFNADDMQWVTGNFNWDSTTDVADLGILGANWSNNRLFIAQSMGHSRVNTSIPEPATLSLFVISMLMVGRKRR